MLPSPYNAVAPGGYMPNLRQRLAQPQLAQPAVMPPPSPPPLGGPGMKIANTPTPKADGDGPPDFNPPITDVGADPGAGDGGGGTTPPDPTGGAGNFFDNIGKWLASGGTDSLTNNAAKLAALATAYQQWRESRRVQDTAKHAADIANPFGGERQSYIEKLRDLYNDPSSIEKTPGYKFALDQGIGATQRSAAAQGYLGSGNMTADTMAYAQGLASQTFNNERNALMRMSGVDFDPANAAKIIMEGEKIGAQDRSSALAAIGQLLKAQSGSTTTINNNTTNGGKPGPGAGKTPDGNQWKPPPTDGANAARTIARLQQAGLNPRDAATLFRTIMNSTDGLSQSTIDTLRDLGLSPGDVGAVDYAPGGYDSGGFGGAPGGGGIFDPDPTSGNPIFDPGWAGRDFTAPPGSFGPTDPFGPGGSGFDADNPINIDDLDFGSINWDDFNFDNLPSDWFTDLDIYG